MRVKSFKNYLVKGTYLGDYPYIGVVEDSYRNAYGCIIDVIRLEQPLQVGDRDYNVISVDRIRSDMQVMAIIEPLGSTVDELERAVRIYKNDLMYTSGDGTRGWRTRIREKIAELEQLIAQGKAHNEKQGLSEGSEWRSPGGFVDIGGMTYSQARRMNCE